MAKFAASTKSPGQITIAVFGIAFVFLFAVGNMATTDITTIGGVVATFLACWLRI